MVNSITQRLKNNLIEVLFELCTTNGVKIEEFIYDKKVDLEALVLELKGKVDDSLLNDIERSLK